MILKTLREEVLEANLELVRRGLVVDTFGNASGVYREKGLVVIKPSGVPYNKLRPSDMVITDLNGKAVEGKLRPSSGPFRISRQAVVLRTETAVSSIISLKRFSIACIPGPG